MVGYIPSALGKLPVQFTLSGNEDQRFCAVKLTLECISMTVLIVGFFVNVFISTDNFKIQLWCLEGLCFENI